MALKIKDLKRGDLFTVNRLNNGVVYRYDGWYRTLCPFYFRHYLEHKMVNVKTGEDSNFHGNTHVTMVNDMGTAINTDLSAEARALSAIDDELKVLQSQAATLSNQLVVNMDRQDALNDLKLKLFAHSHKICQTDPSTYDYARGTIKDENFLPRGQAASH